MRAKNKSIVAALILSVTAACTPDATTPTKDILDGLVQIAAADTASPGAPLGPGSFHGWVVGYAQGPDSVNVFLGNVRVRAHARLNGATVGTVAAETYTDANGAWQLATVTAGEYAVVYEPGPSSLYKSGFTIATTNAAVGAWTVMLPKK